MACEARRCATMRFIVYDSAQHRNGEIRATETIRDHLATDGSFFYFFEMEVVHHVTDQCVEHDLLL